jgi:stage II sporulation protein D
MVIGVSAAEYKDDQLNLEINLAAESSIMLKALNPNSGMHISEGDGLFSSILMGNISISVVNQESLSYFGILLNKLVGEATPGDSLAVVREYFAWEHNRLLIKHELLYFDEHSFSSFEAAEMYAAKMRIPKGKIMEIPVINSTVKISNDRGETIYLETPLRIESDGLKVNNGSLSFDGAFVLKTVKNKLVLNHLLPLEDYLAGVIQNEIGNSSPVEALKAQAVAARTHALSLLINNRHKADGFDLCSSTHCQVYKGKYLQNESILNAVRDCSSEALFIDGNIADATYHSSCGGKTDSSSVIWKGKPVSHLNGVTCIADADSLDLSRERIARQWIDTKSSSEGMSSWERGALSWDKSISLNKLADNVGLSFINEIVIVSRGRSGRITAMKFSGNKEVRLDNEYKIRQAFDNTLSSFFYIKGAYHESGDNIVINPRGSVHLKGKGAGHGVGMCQVGALRMAREGKTYKEILQQYYPGTELKYDWMEAEPYFQMLDAE